jgi:AAA+ superfamily predicted ATPase
MKELQYLADLVRFRMSAYLHADTNLTDPVLPLLDQWSLPVAHFISRNKLTNAETAILLMALAPHVQPDLFDNAIESQLKGSGDFPKIGGVRGKNFRGFLPTGETAIFLLGGENMEQRFFVQHLFSADHFFARNRILWLEDVPQGEPAMSGKIVMSQEYVDYFTIGKSVRPHFNSNFPARYIQTEQEWDDLVLGADVMQQIKELENWLNYSDILMHEWGMKNRLKKGYRVLFHGPPGTGKTFTATLLGKYTGREVYNIDLSMVVSKYIGETEKNLENLFVKAEAKGWILFFDEADALFGKRTNVRDAHDKYANQEVSYLLQRVEDFDGLVILASNMKSNIDDAFIRRFNSIIKFNLPDENERASIWKKSFPRHVGFRDEVDVPERVKKFELTGGNIVNVVQYACLKAIEKKQEFIYLDDVLNGIKREMHKEGKPFSPVV